MLFKKNILINIFLAYILGILIAAQFDVFWIVLYTIWGTTLILTILLHLFVSQSWVYNKWIGPSFIILFFTSGMLAYSLGLPEVKDNNFGLHHLKNDKLIGKIIDYQKGGGQFDKAIVSVEKVVKRFEQVDVTGDLLLYIKGDDITYEVGEIVLFKADLQTIKNKNNPGEFNAEKYWLSKGIKLMAFVPESNLKVIGMELTFKGFWLGTRASIVKIIDKYVSPENSPLVIALTLGDKSNLSVEDKTQFSNSGAMHVLAVSGMHVGILLLFLQWVFKLFKPLRQRNLYLYFAIAFLWCFAFLTGMSASVLRAVMMFSIMAAGQLLGRKIFSFSSLTFSAFILLMVNPMFVFDIGFQLSYLAVIGIVLFFKPIRELYYSRYKLVNYFWEGTALGIAAQIGTVPLTLYYFHQFPNYFLLTNLGVLVMASAAMISVVVLLLLCWIPYLNDLLGWCVDFIFSSFSQFIAWINHLPASVSTGYTPNTLLVWLFYLSIFILLYLWRKASIKYFSYGVAVLFLLCVNLVVGREQNKGKEELIILNHNKKVVLLKGRNTVKVLFEDNEQTKRALPYLVGGYQKQMGVEIKEIPLKPNQTLKLREQLVVKNLNSGMKISYKNQNYFLANKKDEHFDDTNVLTIKGAWNVYIDDEHVDYSSIDGAIRF